MALISRLSLALGLVALGACAEQQAPDDASGPSGLASTLPILASAKSEIGSAQLAGDQFDITLRFVTPANAHLKGIFRTAARRWQRIIVGDVPATTGTIPRNFCGNFGTPRFDGKIDDLLIDVVLQPIDGPGNVLGSAGPCAIRLDDDLSVYGIMFFDTDDLDFIDSQGLLDEVVIHEMGHVLGFGTLWNESRSLLAGAGTRTPRFLGKAAIKNWRTLGGLGRLPVEQDGGPGTADAHWDEETFDNELMTGFLNQGVNPLSNLTALSMRDLGYTVVANGDPYQLPAPNAAAARSHLSGLDLRGAERLIRPVGAVE